MNAAPAISDFLQTKGRCWTLEVVKAETVTPRMRRVSAALAGSEPLDARPGQSLILVLPPEGGQSVSRHYTIRAFDAAIRIVEIDVVLHGDTPANRWARTVRPGDLFSAVGPRGHVRLDETASDHLLLADETGLPAVLSILNALPAAANATAYVEIPSDEERQPVPERAGVTFHWLVRSADEKPGEPGLRALRELQPEPTAGHHTYIVGETSAVRAQHQHLVARGFAKTAISAEGYWRPGRVGGHDHVDD